MFKNLLALFLLTSSFCISQNTIKGTFTPAEDYKFVILYKVTPTTSIYTTNSQIETDGKFEFKLDSTATKGIYRVVYALPQEEHNFDFIYNGTEDIELDFNSETGVNFKASSENKLYESYLQSMSMVTSTIGNFYKQESTDEKALEEIFSTQKDTQKEFEAAAEGMLALDFIKANKPYIPETYEDFETYVSKVKEHYFDAIDFSNETLQSSNFLIERMLNYVFGMVNEQEDATKAYAANIDDIVKAMETSDISIQKTLLEVLWLQMSEGNIESVANHIANNYLMKLATEQKDDVLIDAMTVFKNTSIGAVAPDFSFEVMKDEKPVAKKLSTLDEAERYIVFFWSSTCSHCLEEIPQLKDYIASSEEGSLKVIAIGLEYEPYRWKNMTYDFPDFYHVYGEGKWDNEIGDSYNVTATPSYFVLDTNKNIIEKPEDIVALKKYLKENPLPKKEVKEEEKSDN